MPAGSQPETSQNIAELAELYEATEHFGVALATGETAAAGFGELEEAVATALGHNIGHGLTAAGPGKAMEEAGRSLLNALGGHLGWVAWIHVSYEECKKCSAIRRWWTGESGYWKITSGSEEWQPVLGEMAVTGGFDSPEGAFSAAHRKCQESTAEYKKTHKMCDY